MKKLFIGLLAALSFSTAAAQGFYFGPTGGVNISSLTRQSYSQSRVRGNMGLFAGYQISNIVAIQAEALYSWQGTNVTNSDTKISFNYIKVPVMAKLFLIGGLNVEAGLSFNFLVNSRSQFTDYAGNNHDINTTGKSNKFDFAIPIGVNYLIAKRFELGMRYDISTIKVWNEKQNNSANTNFSINARIRF